LHQQHIKLQPGEKNAEQIVCELNREKTQQARCELRMTTTSASAPPLILRPTTGRVMGYIYLSFLSPLERARTRPFTGKERSKTAAAASQLPARQLHPFLRVFSPTSQRIFLLLLSARSSPLLSHGNIIFIALYVRRRASSGGRPFAAFLLIRFARAAEMLMRQHAGGDASISFLLSGSHAPTK